MGQFTFSNPGNSPFPRVAEKSPFPRSDAFKNKVCINLLFDQMIKGLFYINPDVIAKISI